MYLRDESNDKILMQIITKGGTDFLRAIKLKKIATKRKEKPKCALCKKRIQTHVWMLSINNKPVFDDQLDSPECAEFALSWLFQLLNSFNKNFGPHNIKEEVSEDKMFDPLPIKEGESLRAYHERYLDHLQMCDELTVKFKNDDRAEDHL